MTREKVIEILKAHNNWRRGKLEEMPFTVKELGEAIDKAVELLERNIPPKPMVHDYYRRYDMTWKQKFERDLAEWMAKYGEVK